MIESYKFVKGSLIELCILPDMNIYFIINTLKTSKNRYFIDTKGNLSYYYETIEIFSIEEFKNAIESLKDYHDFVLFIDSIVFLNDNCDSYMLIEMYGLIWDLIYKTECTVVAINHYKMINKNLIPRLDLKWYRIISYRILYKWNGVDITYEIFKLF